MSARVKVELYEARNGQWSYRVIRGARIIIVPGETYVTRAGARRALRSLADISTDSPSIAGSRLHAACVAELERDRLLKH